MGKSGIMESIFTSEYYIPALNGPVSHFFGVPSAYHPVILSSENHHCCRHLEDRRWSLGGEDRIPTIEKSKPIDI